MVFSVHLAMHIASGVHVQLSKWHDDLWMKVDLLSERACGLRLYYTKTTIQKKTHYKKIQLIVSWNASDKSLRLYENVACIQLSIDIFLTFQFYCAPKFLAIGT